MSGIEDCLLFPSDSPAQRRNMPHGEEASGNTTPSSSPTGPRLFFALTGPERPTGRAFVPVSGEQRTREPAFATATAGKGSTVDRLAEGRRLSGLSEPFIAPAPPQFDIFPQFRLQPSVRGPETAVYPQSFPSLVSPTGSHPHVRDLPGALFSRTPPYCIHFIFKCG